MPDHDQQSPTTTPAPVQHGTEGAALSEQSTGSGFGARMAAGELQVARFLHLGGNAPLGEFFDHASMASIGGRKSPESTYLKDKWQHWKGQHVDPKVQSWNKAHPKHARKPDEQHDDVKELTANAVALHTRIQSTQFEDLADEARSLSDEQIQNFVDTLGYDADVPRCRAALGRLLVALPAAKRAFTIAGTVWCDAGFEWANTATRTRALVTMLRERRPGERVLLLVTQPDAVRASVAAVDGTLTAHASVGAPDAMSTASLAYAALFGSVSLVNTDLDWGHMAARWDLLAPATQLLVLKEFFTQHYVQASSINALILATPQQRAAVQADFVARCVDSGKLLWDGWGDSIAAYVTELRAALPADARDKVDRSIGMYNAALATALHLQVVQAPVAPTTPQAPAFESPFLETAAVARPPIHHDHGFLDDGNGNIDPKKHKDPGLGDRANKLAWEARVLAAERLKPELVDATRAYKHFLIDNDGADLVFSYDRYAQSDKSGQHTVDTAIAQANAAAVHFSDLHGGGDEVFKMQTGALGCGQTSPDRPYPATENWQKAIGAHAIWLEATVKVTNSGDHRTIHIDFVLHAEDRYNFNPGSADIASNTLDADNGRFEVTGLGKEFMSLATLRRSYDFVEPAVRNPRGQGRR